MSAPHLSNVALSDGSDSDDDVPDVFCGEADGGPNRKLREGGAAKDPMLELYKDAVNCWSVDPESSRSYFLRVVELLEERKGMHDVKDKGKQKQNQKELPILYIWDQATAILFQFDRETSDVFPIWTTIDPANNAEIWTVLPLPPTDPAASGGGGGQQVVAGAAPSSSSSATHLQETATTGGAAPAVKTSNKRSRGTSACGVGVGEHQELVEHEEQELQQATSTCLVGDIRAKYLSKKDFATFEKRRKKQTEKPASTKKAMEQILSLDELPDPTVIPTSEGGGLPGGGAKEDPHEVPVPLVLTALPVLLPGAGSSSSSSADDREKVKKKMVVEMPQNKATTDNTFYAKDCAATLQYLERCCEREKWTPQVRHELKQLPKHCVRFAVEQYHQGIKSSSSSVHSNLKQRSLEFLKHLEDCRAASPWFFNVGEKRIGVFKNGNAVIGSLLLKELGAPAVGGGEAEADAGSGADRRSGSTAAFLPLLPPLALRVDCLQTPGERGSRKFRITSFLKVAAEVAAAKKRESNGASSEPKYTHEVIDLEDDESSAGEQDSRPKSNSKSVTRKGPNNAASLDVQLSAADIIVNGAAAFLDLASGTKNEAEANKDAGQLLKRINPAVVEVPASSGPVVIQIGHVFRCRLEPHEGNLVEYLVGAQQDSGSPAVLSSSSDGARLTSAAYFRDLQQKAADRRAATQKRLEMENLLPAVDDSRNITTGRPRSRKGKNARDRKGAAQKEEEDLSTLIQRKVMSGHESSVFGGGDE
eukprot:g5821.t1